MRVPVREREQEQGKVQVGVRPHLEVEVGEGVRAWEKGPALQRWV